MNPYLAFGLGVMCGAMFGAVAMALFATHSYGPSEDEGERE